MSNFRRALVRTFLPLTIVMVLVAWWWMRRAERRAAALSETEGSRAECECCG